MKRSRCSRPEAPTIRPEPSHPPSTSSNADRRHRSHTLTRRVDDQEPAEHGSQGHQLPATQQVTDAGPAGRSGARISVSVFMAGGRGLPDQSLPSLTSKPGMGRRKCGADTREPGAGQAWAGSRALTSYRQGRATGAAWRLGIAAASLPGRDAALEEDPASFMVRGRRPAASEHRAGPWAHRDESTIEVPVPARAPPGRAPALVNAVAPLRRLGGCLALIGKGT